MKKNADLILETVLQSSAHMTAEEIHAALRDSGHRMALATVYNNLAQLHSEGRIRKVCVEGHPDRYDKMIRHDHLVCRRCGKLTDICFQDLTKLDTYAKSAAMCMTKPRIPLGNYFPMTGSVHSAAQAKRISFPKAHSSLRLPLPYPRFLMNCGPCRPWS